MKFEHICRELHLSENFIAEISPCQDELMAAASEKLPFFMEKDFYKKYFPWCSNFETSLIYPAMEQIAEITGQNPAVCCYASMMYYAYFCADRKLLSIPWEELTDIFGDNVGIFNLMIAMSSLPLLRKKHIEYGLDEDFTRRQAQWIGGLIPSYAAGRNGKAGFILRSLYWLRLAVDGELFRIGRLEFLERPVSGDMPLILRRKSDGKLAVLCRNWSFNKYNFRVSDDADDVEFRTELEYFDGMVRGTPVNAYGFPVREKSVTLALEQWEKICDAEDACMTVHIPGGGGMTMDKIRESLIAAKKFFLEKFNKKIRIFTCESWIFNPAWERELPDSNFAAFQRNVYLTPCHVPSGTPGTYFVYGEVECDPRERECVTSLHRAFCRVLERGEPLRTGSMFILPEDVEKFGSQYYRSME